MKDLDKIPLAMLYSLGFSVLYNLRFNLVFIKQKQNILLLLGF